MKNEIVIDDVVRSMIQALDQVDIPYMVVGAYSSNYYGVPRLTSDLDIVIDPTGKKISDLSLHLDPDYALDPQSAFETATFSIKNVVKSRRTAFEIELFHLSEDEHNQERFRRRVQVKLPDLSPYLPTPEDVIIQKLRWLLQLNREKDRIDIFNVIRAKNTTLDWPYIESWCDKHGTRQLLEEIRQSVAGI